MSVECHIMVVNGVAKPPQTHLHKEFTIKKNTEYGDAEGTTEYLIGSRRS